MSPWLRLAPLLLSACTFAPSAGSGDDRRDGSPLDPDGGDRIDSGVDSGDPVDATPPLGPFDAPEPLSALSSPSEDDDPTLTADLLELYFNSNRDGDSDLWMSQRSSPDDPWPAPVAVPGLSRSGISESDPEISADGLTLWFTGNETGGIDIWVTTRPDRQSAWATPTRVVELSSDGSEAVSSPDEAGLRILLQSDRTGGTGGQDIYEATRADVDAAWNTPAEVVELDTAGDERGPYLSLDGTLVVFASNRAPSLGEADLFIATRPSPDGAFGAAEHLEELSSTGDDADPWLSPDQRYIVFASTRSGNYELYEARR